MTSQIHLQALWNLKYDNFFEELEKFIEEWKMKKECKCENPECKHYQKEKWNKFGSTINNLFNSSFLMNAVSFKKRWQKYY